MSKKKAVVFLISFGVAALVLAGVLYWFLPRQADELLEKYTKESASAATVHYNYADANCAYILYSYAYQSPSMESCTVTDRALLEEVFDLLSRTTLHLKEYNPHGIAFDDALYGLHFDTVGNSISFRPDGSVYWGNWRYTQGEDTLAEWMSLLERMIECCEYKEKELSFYQSFFAEGSWYAQAVAAPFVSGLCPDLNAMFYDGLSYDENGEPVYGGYVTEEDGAEWEWVRANIPGGDALDVSRLPREGMRTVLKELIYPYTEVPDTLVPEGWTYWEETDCYYHAHGDTGVSSVTLIGGHKIDGTNGCLEFCNAAGQQCYIYFSIGSSMENAGLLHLTNCMIVD